MYVNIYLILMLVLVIVLVDLELVSFGRQYVSNATNDNDSNNENTNRVYIDSVSDSTTITYENLL